MSLACATAVLVALEDGRMDAFGAFCIVREFDALTMATRCSMGHPTNGAPSTSGTGSCRRRWVRLATKAVVAMLEWAFSRSEVTG